MKIAALLTFSLFLGNQIVLGQQLPGNWDKLQFLIGDWVGEGNGQPGQGKGVFSFQPDLDRNVLVRKSHTEYPPSNNRPAFSHDDLMIVYRNSPGSPVKAIYFDNENHIVNYEVSCSDKLIIFTNNAIPDSPRFRLTYEKMEDGKLNIKFEMSSSQNPEEFRIYLEGKSLRK